MEFYIPAVQSCGVVQTLNPVGVVSSTIFSDDVNMNFRRETAYCWFHEESGLART